MHVFKLEVKLEAQAVVKYSVVSNICTVTDFSSFVNYIVLFRVIKICLLAIIECFNRLCNEKESFQNCCFVCFGMVLNKEPFVLFKSYMKINSHVFPVSTDL